MNYITIFCKLDKKCLYLINCIFDILTASLVEGDVSYKQCRFLSDVAYFFMVVKHPWHNLSRLWQDHNLKTLSPSNNVNCSEYIF